MRRRPDELLNCETSEATKNIFRRYHRALPEYRTERPPLMAKLVSILFLLMIALAGAGCDFPRDAAGTLDRVQREGLLRIGVSEHPPWVSIKGESVSGIEVRLLRDFAAAVGAEPRWIPGTESALVRALRRRQIDIVAAGLTKQSPWGKRAAESRRCIHASVVVAVPRGDDVPRSEAEIEGRTITYSSKRPEFAAMIAEKGATPVSSDHMGVRIAAAYDFEVAYLRLVASSIVLARQDHVMLVPPGESAFLLRLERFLSRICPTLEPGRYRDEAGQDS